MTTITNTPRLNITGSEADKAREPTVKEAAALALQQMDAALTGTADYSALRKVLEEVFYEVSMGKGAQRHGNNKPFTEQPMFDIMKYQGPGFTLGQAMKKIIECRGLDPTSRRRELIQAMGYIAGAVIYLDAVGE